MSRLSIGSACATLARCAGRRRADLPRRAVRRGPDAGIAPPARHCAAPARHIPRRKSPARRRCDRARLCRAISCASRSSSFGGFGFGHAASSSRLACARASSVTSAPESMRAISSRRVGLVEQVDAGAGDEAVMALFDQQMAGAAGGDLGRVGDDEDLAAPRRAGAAARRPRWRRRRRRRGRSRRRSSSSPRLPRRARP